MPFFSRVFKKDGPVSSKKNKKPNTNGFIAPQKAQWTDAWLRTQVGPEEVHELLRGCTQELKARALDMPFLLLPFRPASDPSAARTFIRHYFTPSAERGTLKGETLLQELRLTEPMVLCSVLKWCWSRLPGGVVTWEAYELFKVGEQDSQLARDAFATFIPISVESDARTQIIFDFFDLMAAIAAHGKSNGLGGRKLSRFAGWWAFEHADMGKGFDTGYRTWTSAADATSHLFFAYLRSLSPDSARGTNGILSLPISLQTLVQSTEYPPEAPTLMFNSTTKVVMIVDTVSPTPFALLRRAKNFEYRDDDVALQEFSHYDDPVNALTDECRRVLRSISSTNQSTVSTSKASTSLRDASWSRFEDIGFGGTIEESEDEREANGSALPSKRASPNNLMNTTRTRYQDYGRPTTPSWADFLSSGFVDEGSSKSPAPLLLPPDKILPPINTTRGQSSQSHRRTHDADSNLEPGELASINKLDLDDSFWWVWISSLAGEEPTSRKAVFGRCALIETTITGGRWLVMEEQVKGAAPEPEAGAYIAEKKGFFGFTTKKGRLTRRRSGVKKSGLSEELYKKETTGPTMSKTSIGPDQHARIQAAAAALQQKNREQEQIPTNGIRRGRADDTASTKTSSVFTLQPVIMSEASPALKWANQYDKHAIRAAYLGNTLAGKGGSTEMLTLPSNGLPRSDSALSGRSSDRDRELPPIPQEESKPQTPRTEPQPQTPRTEPQPQTPISAPPLPIASEVELRPANKAAEEAAEIPLPTPTIAENPQFFSRAQPQNPATPRQPEAKQSLDASSPDSKDQGKKLKKKQPGGQGFKGMFGKRKADDLPPAALARAESNDAVAAARAALEGKAKSKPQASLAPPQQSSKANRFSGLRRKPAPEIKVAPIPTSPGVSAPSPQAIEEGPQAPGAAEIPLPSPTPQEEGPPRTRRDEEYDALSRVDTNERMQADEEFQSFDHDPWAEQRGFAPSEPIHAETGIDFITPAEFEEREREQAHASPAMVPESNEAEPADLTRQISPVQDRWAQIRKNAAERAAMQSDDQGRRSQGDKTDDGETSGEETIESRVARIKARVAELTGNMENARR